MLGRKVMADLLSWENEKENYTQILTDFTIKDICYQILSFIENGGKDE